MTKNLSTRLKPSFTPVPDHEFASSYDKESLYEIKTSKSQLHVPNTHCSYDKESLYEIKTGESTKDAMIFQAGSYDKESLYEIKTNGKRSRVKSGILVHMTKNLSTRLKRGDLTQLLV